MTKAELSKLVECAQQGDQSAFTQLYEETHSSLYFLALKMMGNEQDAWDIIQEIYTVAFQKLGELTDSSAFRTWLNRITMNHCVNCLRKRNYELAREVEHGETDLFDNIESADENVIPHEYLDNAATRSIIMEIIDKLTEEQRAMILLYYYEEMPTKEIASTLSVSLNVVKQRLFTARQAIKKAIQDYEKKGLKLYAASAIVEVPVLTQLLRKVAEETPIEEEKAKQVLDNVLSSIGFGSGILGTAKAAFAKVSHANMVQAFKAASLVQKAVAIAIAVAVVGGGTAGIVVAAPAISASLTAQQKQPPKMLKIDDVPVSDLAYGQGTADTISLSTGGTQQLSVTASPDNAFDKAITYSSSNEQIVSVDANGNLTAKSAGDAVITVTAASQIASVTLNIQAKDKTISAKNTKNTLDVGDTGIAKLKQASSASVSWTSSNTKVATIGSDGKIKALRAGQTTLNAIVTTPISKQISVHVEAPAPAPAPAPSTASKSGSSGTSAKSSGGSGTSTKTTGGSTGKSTGGTTGGGTTGGGGTGGSTGGSTGGGNTGGSGQTSGTYWFDDFCGTISQIQSTYGISGYNLETYSRSWGGITIQCAKVPSVGADTSISADQAAVQLNAYFASNDITSMSNSQVLAMRGKYYRAEQSGLFNDPGLIGEISGAEGLQLAPSGSYVN